MIPSYFPFRMDGMDDDCFSSSFLFFLFVSLWWQFEKEDNVYDVVNEDEYEEIVRKRRQREDFVVDDGETPILSTTTTNTTTSLFR